MEFNKLKIPTGSNNFLIWVLVFVVILGFGNASKTLGINIFNQPDEQHRSSHKHYGGNKYGASAPMKPALMPPAVPGALSGMLRGNGIFILVIIAILFLGKDSKKHQSNEEVINCDEVIE